MSAKKKKIENTAEKTGEAIGKDIKKGAKAVNDFGKGLKKGLKEKRIKMLNPEIFARLKNWR